MPERTRFAWARLNADTLFLALLATGIGTFDTIDPLRDAVTAQSVAFNGAPHFLHYVRTGVYVLAGILLTVALLRASVRVEVMARCVLFGGVSLNVWRHGVVFGLTDTDTFANVVLLAIILLVSVLRFSVLLGRSGMVVTRAADDGGDH